MPPNPSPDAAPRHRHATYARLGAVRAQPAHCDSAVRKSSSPNPRLPGNDPQAPPMCPRLDHRPTETYGAGHPHMASPSFTRRRVSPNKVYTITENALVFQLMDIAGRRAEAHPIAVEVQKFLSACSP